jgi:hypothetical protein
MPNPQAMSTGNNTAQKIIPGSRFGFWLNLVTGSLLFAADATSRGTQWLFFVKMFFVVAGVVTTVLIRRHVYGGNAEPIVVSATVKRMALLSLAAWVLATTSGRLLAYVQ